MTRRVAPLPTEDQLTTHLARRAALAPPTSTSWILRVMDGADAGKGFRVDDVATRRVLIGQSPACDVRLSDRSVSRRHAALESDSGGVRLVDLGSRNGTWVGRLRIRDTYVGDGELVRFGDANVRLETDGVLHTLAASEEVSFHRVIGASPEMRALYPLLQRIAAADVPVLIEGETGTGKEVLAEAIHEASPRSRGPFVVLDCTTVSASLLEAELFGHERGAFTGAVTARVGLFEEANGGTLFIDEIGDLDVSLQAKLLRALERKEVRRVGSSTIVKLDVRIVAATRRDLDREVQARRFRDDLFYRLAVARIELPALRKRQGDVAFLTRFLWLRMGGDEAALSPDVIQRFESHDWPGNVRELANAVARQLALGDFEVPLRTGGPPAPSTGIDVIDRIVKSGQALPLARQAVLEEFERRYVEHMLAEHGGNVTRAAAASGIGRRYFQIVRAKR
jgi:DNA-binding NtrC family response regulator